MRSNIKNFNDRIDYLNNKAKEIRLNIVEMVFIAQSGHPGGALSSADFMTALYFDLLNIDPKNPHWPDRDRFILSKGHTCPVWYACLAMRGYFPMSELKTLRKFGSLLQGHPDMRKTPGIDMTTGSLGQGLSCGVGMALEGKMLKKDYMVYVVLGDGELNEGQVWEASESASKFALDNLVVIIDKNRLQMDGFTEQVMPMEPVDKKFEAFNWKVTEIDGHDMALVVKTLESAKEFKGKPVCIVANTIKGKGVSYMENIREWHGKAPTAAQYKTAVRELKGEG